VLHPVRDEALHQDLLASHQKVLSSGGIPGRWPTVF
jgi:hypothetical protein